MQPGYSRNGRATANTSSAYRKVPIAVAFRIRQATIVRRASRSSINTGKEEKRRKIPSNRDLRAGTFFPLLPGFFSEQLPFTTIYEAARHLLDCVRSNPSVYWCVAGGVHAHSHGDVWRAAGPGGESLLADGFVSFDLCAGDCDLDRMRAFGNCRRTGASWKCASWARNADCGRLFGIVGDAV